MGGERKVAAAAAVVAAAVKVAAALCVALKAVGAVPQVVVAGRGWRRRRRWRPGWWAAVGGRKLRM